MAASCAGDGVKLRRKWGFAVNRLNQINSMANLGRSMANWNTIYNQ
jgi:hypothetical protein